MEAHIVRFSIIIVCYRDYASLERCIASVRSSGVQDYEIIILDNSPHWVETVGEQKEALGRILKSGGIDYGNTVGWKNVGFAAGCNIAARRAKGDILIFLNPDTQVFGNWADDMAKGIEGDYAAVGPVSNYVAGLQKVEMYGGQDLGFRDTLLLIGFCLMIRRDVFEEVGGMDEKLFLGCDDLDLSWRLQRAGYKMRIATGVFVHHEGHTSMVLNPEKDRLIKASERVMRDKLVEFYGPDVPTSEELWGCKILAPVLKPMRLSVCMIVRDASEVSPKPWFADERHVFIAGEVENFAEARNHALSKCTGDWVLWLDSDDEVPEESAKLIDALIHKPGNNVALQACHFAFRVENVGKDGETRDYFDQSRLFPRLPGIEWSGVGGCKGYAHETYFESCVRLGLPMVATNIVIRHHGYADKETEIRKADRNLKLLLKEPDNCFKWYNIGTSHLVAERPEEAVEAFEKAISMKDGQDPYFVDHCRYTLAMALIRADRLEGVFGLLEGNKKPDSLFILGKILIESGEVEKGCDLLWKYLKMGEIRDNLGTNCPHFRRSAVQTLTDIGVLKV